VAGPRFPETDERLVLDADCSRCPALADARTCIAWGNGPLDADVVVVGEAPAAGDPERERWRGGNHTGVAYTSAHSGRRVRWLFADLGYADRTFYTNAVKCFPRDDDAEGETNREPTEAERANCRAHLRTEIDRVDPAVVVPTGKHATASVLAFEGRTVDGFLDLVLSEIPLPSLSTRAVPLLHPSYQAVWLARLGYDEAEYRAELAALLPD
jgi:uracil-DNA glycosylase family 4